MPKRKSAKSSLLNLFHAKRKVNAQCTQRDNKVSTAFAISLSEKSKGSLREQ